MSNDYFFTKWKGILLRLEYLTQIDQQFQTTKAHDKTLCQAAQRLEGTLGEYIAVYNEAVDSFRQNLQVQKTQYMDNIIHAVVSRIIELKHQLGKLTATNYQFMGQGLADHKLTPQDAEFTDIPDKIGRPESLKVMLKEIMIRAHDERERLAKMTGAEEVEDEEIDQWWDDDEPVKQDDIINFQEKKEKLSEETLKIRELVNMIGAHERTRQVTQMLSHQKLKRSVWEKELLGIAAPKARQEIRERAADFIKKACRYYFELKRKRIVDCKRDELLGFKMCKKQSDKARKKTEELNTLRAKRYTAYENEWIRACEELKQKYFKHKAADIADDFRDFVRDWFQQWYDQVRFFYDIPSDTRGGSNLILKEELPNPDEWVDLYKAYMAEKKANQGKSSHQSKQEQQNAKRESMMLKREQQMKAKMEADMMKKLMKNPSNHPGYTYPASRKIEDVVTAVADYHKDWGSFDECETLDVKQRFVKSKDKQTTWMEVKMDVIKSVDEDMRKELKLLRKALKEEYERNEEQMPEVMKERAQRAKKKKKLKGSPSGNVIEKTERLAVQCILKEYPPTKLADFLGDPNYAGDDLPCSYRTPTAFNGETRGLWWENCREVGHGSHRLLLVGPRGSGKTMLVHIMATLNDAVLFELDPSQIPEDQLEAQALQQLVSAVSASAKAFQPSVIYLKHVHRIFYSKVPKEEPDINPELLKRYIVKKLFKSINKTDNITIIGSCIEPWLTKSAQILKQFPQVVLMPDTSYSTTVQLLKHWVMNNRMVPTDLDIHSLAYSLKGYSYGYLKEYLENFLSADQIVKIAAKSLFPEEIYDYITSDEKEEKPDYEKYLKWYRDKTPWGHKEKKHAQDQSQFKELLDKFADRGNKKKNKQLSAPSSSTSLVSNPAPI